MIAVSTVITHALKNFHKWSSSTKLTINESKTKIMSIASGKMLKKLQKPQIKLGDTLLKVIDRRVYMVGL